MGEWRPKEKMISRSEMPLSAADWQYWYEYQMSAAWDAIIAHHCKKDCETSDLAMIWYVTECPLFSLSKSTDYENPKREYNP